MIPAPLAARWAFESPGHDDPGTLVVEIVGSDQFEVETSWGEPSATGRRDVRISVTFLGTQARAARVQVGSSLPAADPWWLIPGLFYGENRPEGCLRTFPRFEVGADRPQELVSSHWEFRADRAATPAVMVWGDAGGVALIVDEESAVGTTGLLISHDEETGQATVGVRFPFHEHPVTYYGSAEPRPAESLTHTWQPGESRTLTVAVCGLVQDRHSYAPLLREDAERRATDSTPWVDVSTAAGLAAEGLVRWHYDPEPGVLLETVGFDREVNGNDGRPVDRQAMHVGWVSGLPWAAALLAHGRRTGDERQVTAAERVIDFICANLSPSGTFWGTWYRDRGWVQSWTPLRGGLHARTLGEATLFLVRALNLSGTRPTQQRWVAAARSNLDVVARRQRADGNLGAIHHAETGEVLSWQGASGLMWVAALAEAGDLDEDEGYLHAAALAGDYYAQFVEREFIYGAAEDVDLAPTSEDGYAAVIAYMSLYRRTRAPRWLDLACRSADWMLTFRYAYDVHFAERSPLGVYRFASRGADQASPSNQHLHAFGLICTGEMFDLAEAVGDSYYARRAAETLACFRQLLATEDGECNAYRGMVTERYYQTSCFQPKGMYLTLSHAWSVGVLLHGCEEALRRGAA